MLTDRMHARTLVAHKCLHKPTPSMAQVHTGERPHVSGEPEGRGVGRLSDNLSPDATPRSLGDAQPHHHPHANVELHLLTQFNKTVTRPPALVQLDVRGTLT